MTDEIRKQVFELLKNGCDASKIIEENLPLYLYKYRNGNEWDLDALENDSIWIGNASKMDDPLDSKFALTSKDKKQLEYMINIEKPDKASKYKKLLDDNAIQKDCFLCCFSEIADSEDMWKNYANNEYGFCIEYNTKELESEIKFLLLPVYYDKKVQYSAQELSNMSKREMIVRTFLLKNKIGENGEDWNSQREWRIISFRKSLGLSETVENGTYISVPKPTKIILGKRVLDNVKKRILNWNAQNENKHVIIEQRDNCFLSSTFP